MAVTWDKNAQENFSKMIEKVPVFMRQIARDKVAQKAENIAAAENRSTVSEKDMVDAFFAATPFGFHGPMKNDMEDLGIDYSRYGHKR